MERSFKSTKVPTKKTNKPLLCLSHLISIISADPNQCSATPAESKHTSDNRVK